MSPLENFIYLNFEDSIEYLKDMYHRIYSIFLKCLLKNINEECKLIFDETNFEMDIKKGEYKLILINYKEKFNEL